MDFYLVQQESRDVTAFFQEHWKDEMSSDDEADFDDLKGIAIYGNDDNDNQEQDDNADANMAEIEEPQEDNQRINGDGDREEDEDNERDEEVRRGSTKAITIGDLEVDLEPTEGTEHNRRFVVTLKRAVGTEHL